LQGRNSAVPNEAPPDAVKHLLTVDV